MSRRTVPLTDLLQPGIESWSLGLKKLDSPLCPVAVALCAPRATLANSSQAELIKRSTHHEKVSEKKGRGIRTHKTVDRTPGICAEGGLGNVTGFPFFCVGLHLGALGLTASVCVCAARRVPCHLEQGSPSPPEVLPWQLLEGANQTQVRGGRRYRSWVTREGHLYHLPSTKSPEYDILRYVMFVHVCLKSRQLAQQ